jgi:hypothetical protein
VTAVYQNTKDFSSCFKCEVAAVSPLPNSWEVIGEVSDTTLWESEFGLDEFTPGREVDVPAKFSSFLESDATGSSTVRMGVANWAR